MLATSWKATGLVRAAWLRLDVPKDKRGELARLTGIPPTNLSGMNRGRLPMTPETALRIVQAVPGLTLEELGAPEEQPAIGVLPVGARLEALEALVARLYAETARGFEHLGHRQHGLGDQEESRNPGRGQR